MNQFLLSCLPFYTSHNTTIQYVSMWRPSKTFSASRPCATIDVVIYISTKNRASPKIVFCNWHRMGIAMDKPHKLYLVLRVVYTQLPITISTIQTIRMQHLIITTIHKDSLSKGDWSGKSSDYSMSNLQREWSAPQRIHPHTTRKGNMCLTLRNRVVTILQLHRHQYAVCV